MNPQLFTSLSKRKKDNENGMKVYSESCALRSDNLNELSNHDFFQCKYYAFNSNLKHDPEKITGMKK